MNKNFKTFKVPLQPIFHYCSVESFLSILRTSEIFLSHSQYLNDHMESKWIKEIILQCKKHPEIKFDVFRINKIQKIISYYKGDAYLGCFSSKKDTLSQWRSYADNGFGVAIGFDTNQIEKLLSDRLKFHWILYDKEHQTQEAMAILGKYIPFKKNTLYQNDYRKKIIPQYHHLNKEKNVEYHMLSLKEMSNISFKDIFNERKTFTYEESKNIVACVKELLILSHRIKNPGFHEESEHRLYYLPNFLNHQEEDCFVQPLQHRVSEKRIIPYHSFKFSQNKSILNEIVLGPRCLLDEPSVRSVLKNNGYKSTSISRSKTSYR